MQNYSGWSRQNQTQTNRVVSCVVDFAPVANDTTSYISQLNALIAQLSGTGGGIITCGANNVIVCDRSIIPASNVWIIGAGRGTTVFNVTTMAPFAQTPASQISNFKLTNVGFVCGAATFWGATVLACTNMTDCEFDYIASTGFYTGTILSINGIPSPQLSSDQAANGAIDIGQFLNNDFKNFKVRGCNIAINVIPNLLPAPNPNPNNESGYPQISVTGNRFTDWFVWACGSTFYKNPAGADTQYFLRCFVAVSATTPGASANFIMWDIGYNPPYTGTSYTGNNRITDCTVSSDGSLTMNNSISFVRLGSQTNNNEGNILTDIPPQSTNITPVDYSNGPFGYDFLINNIDATQGGTYWKRYQGQLVQEFWEGNPYSIPVASRLDKNCGIYWPSAGVMMLTGSTGPDGVPVNALEITNGSILPLVPLYMTVAIIEAPSPMLEAAEVTPNLLAGTALSLTITQNTLIENPIGVIVGAAGSFIFTQDSVGGHAVTWGSEYQGNGANAIPVVDTAANSVTVIDFRAIGATQVVLK